MTAPQPLRQEHYDQLVRARENAHAWLLQNRSDPPGVLLGPPGILTKLEDEHDRPVEIAPQASTTPSDWIRGSAELLATLGAPSGEDPSSARALFATS
jgi:hypothetical protein